MACSVGEEGAASKKGMLPVHPMTTALYFILVSLLVAPFLVSIFRIIV